MVQSEFFRASPNAHLLIGQMPAPHQLHGPGWEGTGLSIAAHAILLGVLVYAATHVPQVVQAASVVTDRLKVVLLDDRPGRGAARKGGGDESPDPSRPAELVPSKPIQLTPADRPMDTPTSDVMVPVVTVQAQQMLPGALVPVDPRSLGGSGRGPGNGPGDGPGLGPGGLGGFGDAPGAGNGVSSPVLIKEVKPNYTAQAMGAKLQGAVEMEAVVLSDGSVDPASIRITRSLDSIFGLDQQAIIAVKQWRFRPGTFKGQAVAVRVNIELTFTLR
jgi:TonB family protein